MNDNYFFPRLINKKMKTALSPVYLLYILVTVKTLCLPVRHLKPLALPVFLHSVCNGQSIVHVKLLEDIQASIDIDLPTCICNDMPGMDGSLDVILPGEVDAYCLHGITELIQVVLLLCTVELIGAGDQLYMHLILRSLDPGHGLKELHHIPYLEISTDIWISNQNLCSTNQVGTKQHIIGNAFLAFLIDLAGVP